MKKSFFIALIILTSSLAKADANSVGGCLDKVSEAAINQILAESKGDSFYAMTSASITNRFDGATKIADFRQDIVISFDTSDNLGRVVKTFKTQVNNRCEFTLIETK